MKRVLPALTVAFVATMVLFVANSANAAPKPEGNEITKVNVDSKGVILKGYDAVAYFTQGKPVKGILKSRVPTRAQHTCFLRQRIKPLFSKIRKVCTAVWRVLRLWGFYRWAVQYRRSGRFCLPGQTLRVWKCCGGPNVQERHQKQYRQSGCELGEVNRLSVPKTLATCYLLGCSANATVQQEK